MVALLGRVGRRSVTGEFARALGEEILAATADGSNTSNDRGNLLRFAENLQIAADLYYAAVSEAGPNDIRRELKALNSAALRSVEPPNNIDKKPMSKKAIRYRLRLATRFAKVQVLIRALNPTTSQLLRDRLRQRIDLTPGISMETLLPMGTNEVEQANYCWQIVALSQTGRGLEEGRLRPGNKQSRPSTVALLYAPSAEMNPKWRAPERELETQLALAWLELTGMIPRNDEAYRTFVENVFEQLGVEQVDVAELTKECRSSTT